MVELGREMLISLFFDLETLVRVFEKMPELSLGQIVAFTKMLKEEPSEIKELSHNKPMALANYIQERSYYCPDWQQLRLARYYDQDVERALHERALVSPPSPPVKAFGDVASLGLARDLLNRLATDSNPTVREDVARALFTEANKISKEDANPDAYSKLITLFSTDTHGPVREQAARAAFNRAHDIAKRDGDPDAYLEVMNRFNMDTHPPVREQAAMAAFNRAYRIAERDGDPDAYLEVMNRFSADSHPPVRENAAMAAIGRADAIAERDKTPDAYADVFDRFGADDAPAIAKRVLACRRKRVGWLVVVGENATAVAEGEALLLAPDHEQTDLLVLAFLVWLASPSDERRMRVERGAERLPVGTRTAWSFDEFAEVVAALSSADRAFATYFIRAFESGAGGRDGRAHADAG